MTPREAHNLACAAEKLAHSLRLLDRMGAVPSPRFLADVEIARAEMTAAAALAVAEMLGNDRR